MGKYLQLTLRLWKLLKPFQKDFYLQLFLILISQVITIVSTILLAKSINHVVSKEFILASYFVIYYLIINIAKAYIGYFKELNSIKRLSQSIYQYLQEYSFNNIFKLNASQYIEDHSAVKLQVINRGEEAIQNIVSTIVLSLLPTATQITFSLLAIAWYSIPVAFITFATLVIVIAWTNYFSNFHRPFIRKNIELWDIQRKIRTEAFQHLSLIKVSGVEDTYLKKYLHGREGIVEHDIKTRNLVNIHGTKRWNFFSVSNTTSRLTLIYYAYLGKIMVGEIYAIWTWISDATNNIFAITQAMRTIPINFVELEKYLEIIDKKPEFSEAGNKKFLQGNIVFSNLSFKYPKGEKNILDNLNFEIEGGKKTAFVGFSGSGKSTIIKLLLRIYDFDSGEIKIGNLPLREINTKNLRQHIGYVEQHVELFDTTIRENVLFGIPNKKVSDSDLQDVIRLARIDQFFHRLGEKGLETVIGEKGIKLSGGERQRIGIARAIIKNPDILIFDEATASLDTENEKYIQEAIDESSLGRTTIIIAHRLSTVQNADKIIVMDKGVIVATGTHEELLTNSPEYQRLVHAQTN